MFLHINCISYDYVTLLNTKLTEIEPIWLNLVKIKDKETKFDQVPAKSNPGASNRMLKIARKQ